MVHSILSSYDHNFMITTQLSDFENLTTYKPSLFLCQSVKVYSLVGRSDKDVITIECHTENGTAVDLQCLQAHQYQFAPDTHSPIV